MPRSGGTYTRTDGTRTGPTVWQQARDGGVKIVAVGEDTHDQDVADALTASVANDGQTPILANLPMSTFRHTGVGDGAARTDYASAGQTQDGSLNWVDGGGAADAITATYSPVLTALVDGQLCHVRATAANATTTPTFAPNGLTAHTIVKEGGSALALGDIVGDGHELILRYDLANTRWDLLNPSITSLGVIQAGAFRRSGTAGGTKNALTLSPSPAITAYATGQRFTAIIGGTSSDAAATLVVSALATKAIEIDNGALTASIILVTGKTYDFEYDGTAFQATRLSTTDAGGDMLGANNLSDVASAATSRSNLGLGTAAVKAHGTGAGDVPLNSDLGSASLVATGTSSGNVPLVGTKSSTVTLAGLVERSTSAENVTGTDDTVTPTVAGVKEMIDTHASGGPTISQIATTSGGSVGVTGIAATTKFFDVILSGVSASSTTNWQFQIGDSGGYETSGYDTIAGLHNAALTDSPANTGAPLDISSASGLVNGTIRFTKTSGNDWAFEGQFGLTESGTDIWSVSGTKTLTGTLDRVQIDIDGSGNYDNGLLSVVEYE